MIGTKQYWHKYGEICLFSMIIKSCFFSSSNLIGGEGDGFFSFDLIIRMSRVGTKFLLSSISRSEIRDKIELCFNCIAIFFGDPFFPDMLYDAP